MFKRIVNNQALINGLRQISYGIKRETSSSSSDDQQSSALALSIETSSSGNNAIISTSSHHHVILAAPNNNNILDVNQFDQFCSNNQLVSSNSVVSKVGQQILVEMGPRIMEIILQHMNESVKNHHQPKVCRSDTMVTTSGESKSQNTRMGLPPSDNMIENKQEKPCSDNKLLKKSTTRKNFNRFEGNQFYGTNTMFLMDEEIKTTALQNSQTELMLQKSAQIIETESPSNSLGIDTVKALLLDMYGKIAQFVANLSQQLFGKLFTADKGEQKINHAGMISDMQGKVMLNTICNQSVLIVISFMLYEIVIFNSAPTCHSDIQIVFQEFLSKIMTSM